MFNTQDTLQKKVKKTYSIDRTLAESFKVAANKDARNMSKVIEGYMKRYVESKS